MNAKVLLFCALLFGLCAQSHAESKRVYVYQLGQEYWDVRPGETLGGIAEALLPGSQQHRQRLMDDILRLNPDAFIDQDPNRLLAYARLWLPNAVTKPVSNPENAEIREFDWGNIKRLE